ncbi:hypothetical protein Tco_1525507 [Tanacetum coccineum]
MAWIKREKWRFRFERDAFWVKVIKSLYGERGGTVGQSLSGSGYSVWHNIVKVGNDLDKIGIHLSSSFEWEVGSGNAIMFWEDNLIGIKGFWRRTIGEWNWVGSADLIRGRAITDMHNLSNLVQDIQLKKDTKDKCKCRLNDGGSFTVKGFRNMVDSKILERIPVRVILDNMGIDLHSVLCPCCEESIELLDHCFVLCPKVKPIWDRVLQWWDVGIVWSVLYFIWTFRNQVVFKGNESKILDLFKEVQGRAFEWIAARMKKDHLRKENRDKDAAIMTVEVVATIVKCVANVRCDDEGSVIDMVVNIERG